MNITGIVRALVATGATPEMILAAVEAAEAEILCKEERRREKQRERTRKCRLSRNVTLQNVTSRYTPLDGPPPPPAPPSPPLNPPASIDAPGQNARARRISEDWKPSGEEREFARKRGWTEDQIDFEALRFLNHWASKAGPDAAKRSWPRTWQNWILKAEEMGTGPPGVMSPNGSRQGGRSHERINPKPQKRSGHDSLLAALARRFGDGDEPPWPPDDTGGPTIDLSPAPNGRGYVL